MPDKEPATLPARRSRNDDAGTVVQQYAADFRAVIEKLRRKLD